MEFESLAYPMVQCKYALWKGVHMYVPVFTGKLLQVLPLRIPRVVICCNVILLLAPLTAPDTAR